MRRPARTSAGRGGAKALAGTAARVVALAGSLAASGGEAAELCHTATVGRDRAKVKFCVDPEAERMTRYGVAGGRTETVRQSRRGDTIEGVLILRPGRLEPPLRVTSRYVLREPADREDSAGKSRATYQVCSLNVLTDASCASVRLSGAPPRCWKPCSGWYGYLPGVATKD